MDGTINSAGLNNEATGTLVINDTGLFVNTAGFVAGGDFIFNGGGELRLNSPLVDVQNLIIGNPNFVFADGFGPKFTDNLDGSVSVTNAPEPLTLSLLAFGETALLRRKKA